MRHPIREVIALSLAAAACLLMMAGMGWTVIVYNGANVPAYSPFNHLFSELGWAKHSPAAGLFNFCLSAASVLIAPLFWLLGRRLSGLLARTAAVVGIASTWACYCVGLIPLGPSPLYLPYQEGRVGLHFLVAVIFFWTWIATMILTLAALISSARGRRMWLLVGVSLLALGAGLAFIAVPKERILTQLARGIIKERADFYWTSTLEWYVVASIGLWLVAATCSLWVERSKDDRSRDLRRAKEG